MLWSSSVTGTVTVVMQKSLVISFLNAWLKTRKHLTWIIQSLPTLEIFWSASGWLFEEQILQENSFLSLKKFDSK